MIDITYVSKPRSTSRIQRAAERSSNRKYTYKQVKRVVKWTLITGGILYFAEKMECNHNETLIIEK